MAVSGSASGDSAPPFRAPFDGPVTFDEVAARIEQTNLGDAPPTMRRRFARLLLGDTHGAPLVGEAVTVGGVDAWRVKPGDARRDAVVVWFHGGGYVFGSPETHIRPAWRFAQQTRCPVVLPRYRLAPERRWPAQRTDALAVVRGLQDEGTRVVLAGDSAGGHLALVAALRLAADGTPPTALALFSPNTDRTGLSDTRAANSDRDPMNDDAQDRALADLAFAGRPYDHPDASPVLADLSMLPPTYVEVGDCEVLLGDARLLARRARESGADVRLHVEAGAFHMWQVWTPWLPEADASLGRAAAFVCEHLDG